MSSETTFPVPQAWARQAWIDEATYRREYERSAPDRIQWATGLPKTRSGKIMRRVPRKIAVDDTEQLGDTSTLADPAVIEGLISGRREAMVDAR